MRGGNHGEIIGQEYTDDRVFVWNGNAFSSFDLCLFVFFCITVLWKRATLVANVLQSGNVQFRSGLRVNHSDLKTGDCSQFLLTGTWLEIFLKKWGLPFYSCVLPGSCQLLERYLFLKEKVKKTKLFGSENYNFGMGFSVYFTV